MSDEELHAAHITNIGSYFENIISTVSNLWSNTKTMEDSTEYFLQGLSALYYDIQKDILFHMGVILVSGPTLRIAWLQLIFHIGRVGVSNKRER